MGFSRQEYRSGLPLPSPGDLPDPGKHQTCVSCVSCTGRKVLYHECHLGSPRSAHVLFYSIVYMAVRGSKKKKKKTQREKMAEAIHFWVLEIEIPTKWCTPGTCLVAQGLRLPLPMQGVPVQSLVGSWDPTCLVAKKPNHKKQKKYCDKCNQDFKNSLHLKKKSLKKGILLAHSLSNSG